MENLCEVVRPVFMTAVAEARSSVRSLRKKSPPHIACYVWNDSSRISAVITIFRATTKKFRVETHVLGNMVSSAEFENLENPTENFSKVLDIFVEKGPESYIIGCLSCLSFLVRKGAPLEDLLGYMERSLVEHVMES